MELKHIKLFESFGHMAFNPGDVAVAIVGEGADVSVFSKDQASKLSMISKNLGEDDYIQFFYFNVKPGDKYLYVKFEDELEVSLIGEETAKALEDLIPVYYADGEISEGDDYDSGYVIELVGGNKYSSVQSWGNSVEDGAFEHFTQEAMSGEE